MKSSDSKKILKTFLIMLSIVTILFFINNILLSQTPDFPTGQRIGGIAKDDGGSSLNVEKEEIFIINLTGTISSWKVPVTVTDGTTSFSLTFGGEPNATDGYDAGLDVPTAPPGMTYYAYLETIQFPYYLSTDMRAWVAPYNTNIDWTLKVVNATGKTSTITWDSANFPLQGTFTLEGLSSNVNMRVQSSVTFTGDKTLTIRYRLMVDIWPPADTTGAPNSIVNIPIYVRDVTNKGIYSFALTVTTQTNVLTPLGATTLGTITSPWGSPIVGITGGEIKIVLAGASPLAGTGKQVLVYVKYQVGATPKVETPITLSQVIFNEGQPIPKITHGKFTIASNFSISGKANYYSNPQAVPRASMALTGNVAQSTLTDLTGSYQLANLPGGNYVLKSSKSKEVGTAISSYDASMILRYSVGSISLMPYQLIAGDVSGNGQVTSYDASLILRYSVGLITQFPVGRDWKLVPKSFPINENNWIWAPDSLVYKPLNADQSNQDFVGIVYGDVSGNWPGASLIALNYSIGYNINNIQHTSVGKWLVPLELEFSDTAFSGSFKLLFDQTRLKCDTGSIADPSMEILLASANTSGGANFAFASPQPLLNQVLTINLLFEEKTPFTPANSDFQLADILVDDKTGSITAVHNRQNNELPAEWHLSQNHPNPFNATTVITYQVPKSAPVTIAVFNLLGQRLKTLVDEEKNAGTYQTTWNGIDDQGRAVGSGIYVYRMKAGEFTATNKMVLVR